MMLEPLLAPFTDKGKEVSTRVVPGFDTGTNTETGGTFGDQRGSVLRLVHPAPVVLYLATCVHQKSCDQCVAQKIPCAVAGVRVSNWKQQDRSEAGGSQCRKKSWVEESEWSRLG